MPDSARLMVTLRRSATATELLITATISTAIKLPPSQLHVERQAPLSPVFFVVMKGSQLYSAKEAVRRFLRMYQDSASSLYASSTSRAIFAGSEVEVIKYLPPPSVAEQPLPPLNIPNDSDRQPVTQDFTFRRLQPKLPDSPRLSPSPTPAAARSVSLSTWSSSVLTLRQAKPVMSVQHSPVLALPFRRRPSLSTWFSDKILIKAVPMSESTAPTTASVRISDRRESVRPREVPVVRRSTSSIRLKSPVRASEEEDDVFPRAALRGNRQKSEGSFSVLSEVARRDEAVSRSDFSASEATRSRRSVRRQSSLWDKDDAGAVSEGASSTGWSWLWGGEEDSDEDAAKAKNKRRR